MLTTETTTTVTTATIDTLVPLHAPLAIPMTIPDAINAAHEAARGAGRTMLRKAREAGDLLLQAKAGCAHGEFKAWVEENCECSFRQAQKYMQVAKCALQGAFDIGDFDGGIDAFLKAHTDKHPTSDEGETVRPTRSNTTSKVSDMGETNRLLKVEISCLAEELQTTRDKLASAEAYIADLKSTAPVAVSPGGEAVEALQRDVAELNELLDEAEKIKRELQEENRRLKHSLSKATGASPKAAAAVRPGNAAYDF